jgi:hypothetical protein
VNAGLMWMRREDGPFFLLCGIQGLDHETISTLKTRPFEINIGVRNAGGCPSWVLGWQLNWWCRSPRPQSFMSTCQECFGSTVSHESLCPSAHSSAALPLVPGEDGPDPAW